MLVTKSVMPVFMLMGLLSKGYLTAFSLLSPVMVSRPVHMGYLPFSKI